MSQFGTTFPASFSGGAAVSGAPVVHSNGTPVVPKTVTWDSPQGVHINLTDYATGHAHGPGRTGFGAAPVDVKWDELAIGGGQLRNIRPLARTLSWTQIVQGGSQAEFDARWTRLLEAMVPEVGGDLQPGRLTVTHFDGRSRYVDAFYSGGLEGAEDRDAWSGIFAATPLRMIALDPFFRDADETVIDVAAGRTPVPFYKTGGLYPLSMAPSQVLSKLTIPNGGTRETYPIIEVTGPGTGLIARNLTLGQEFRLTAPILAGNTITFDTAAKTVTDSDGTSWRRYLPFPGSTLWPLARGDNRLTFTLTGTDGNSRVRFRFRRRWNQP